MASGVSSTPSAQTHEAIEPAPIDLPRPGIVPRARRLARTLALSARNFAPVAAARVIRRGRDGDGARAARQLFESLGATYVKFGQFVASAPGIVGEATAEEFRGTLDTGPRVPFDDVRATVEAEIGRPLESAFAGFERTPVAAASIAVVHRATLLDGSDVAVKVLRPGIEETVAADIGILEPAVRAMAWCGVDQSFNLVSYIVGLRMQVCEELDLRNETRTMGVFRRLFEEFGLHQLVVPRAYPELSGRRVLTMEMLDGVAIDDLEKVSASGFDPAPLVQELLRAWILTGLRVAAFHADIHAGNLLLLRDGRLGMVDWGIVARMDPDTHVMFRRLIEASLGEDEAWDDITTYMARVQGEGLRALGLTDEQIGRMVRSMLEPLLTLPLRDVSMATLFTGSTDEVIQIATGEDAAPRTLRRRLETMRIASRAYRHAMRERVYERPTARANFLAAKQLVYLERYGRMYMPDESILGDREFLRRALAGGGPVSPAG